MKCKNLAMGAGLLTVTIGLLSAPAETYGSAVATGHRDILLQAQQSWNGKRYTKYPSGQPELTMIKLTIKPHTVLPWHTHPVPNSVYVLSGTLTIHDRDTGKNKTFYAGQAFAESVDSQHRGESGDQPTVLLITYAGATGVPTSLAASGEMPEY